MKMDARTLSTTLILAVLGGCGGRGESERKPAVEKSSEGSIGQADSDRKQPIATANSGPDIRPGLLERRAELERIATDPEYKRRRMFENLDKSTQLFLGIRKAEIAPTKVRADGLLQRRISFEVKTAFAGVQAEAVVSADELVADQDDFMDGGRNSGESERGESPSREPKAYLVRLEPCLEEDGTERLVMYRAHVASATELSELAEDSKRYSAKGNYPLRACNIGTLPLFEQYIADVELQGDFFPVPKSPSQ